MPHEYNYKLKGNEISRYGNLVLSGEACFTASCPDQGSSESSSGEHDFLPPLQGESFRHVNPGYAFMALQAADCLKRHN